MVIHVQKQNKKETEKTENLHVNKKNQMGGGQYGIAVNLLLPSLSSRYRTQRQREVIWFADGDSAGPLHLR